MTVKETEREIISALQMSAVAPFTCNYFSFSTTSLTLKRDSQRAASYLFTGTDGLLCLLHSQ